MTEYMLHSTREPLTRADIASGLDILAMEMFVQGAEDNTIDPTQIDRVKTPDGDVMPVPVRTSEILMRGATTLRWVDRYERRRGVPQRL